MVSVPCVTTAPLAASSMRLSISEASSTRSSTVSSPDAAWRNETADTSATSAISGTSETSASPVSVGSTPLPPESTEEMVPPSEKTVRSEEHTSELQSRQYLVCRLLLEKKNAELIPHHLSAQAD